MAGVLILASLLQVCGCNPLINGSHAPGAALPARDWGVPVTGSGVAELRQHQKRRFGLNVPELQNSDKAPLRKSRGEEDVSFYDPDPGAVPDDSSVSNSSSSMSSLASDVKPEPWPIPESVFFVYKDVIGNDGSAHRVPNATAFVVSVPDRQHRNSARFLVTARHVVDPEWAHCAGKNPLSIEIRLNRRNGGVGYETISLQTDHLQSFLAPSDETSDIAVVRLDSHLIPNIESYKFMDTPFRLLPTELEAQTFGTDQQIMTAGLLTRVSQEANNYPVSHAGVLSGMSGEPVNIQCSKALDEKQLHMWFIRAGVPDGVSGAPVYTSMSRNGKHMKTPVLLGIQTVAWPDRGVAGITPSAVLSDLIETALRDRKQQMDFYKGANP